MYGLHIFLSPLSDVLKTDRPTFTSLPYFTYLVNVEGENLFLN